MSNNSIRPIDNPSSATTQTQSGTGSDGNEETLPISLVYPHHQIV